MLEKREFGLNGSVATEWFWESLFSELHLKEEELMKVVLIYNMAYIKCKISINQWIGSCFIV